MMCRLHPLNIHSWAQAKVYGHLGLEAGGAMYSVGLHLYMWLCSACLVAMASFVWLLPGIRDLFQSVEVLLWTWRVLFETTSVVQTQVCASCWPLVAMYSVSDLSPEQVCLVSVVVWLLSLTPSLLHWWTRWGVVLSPQCRPAERLVGGWSKSLLHPPAKGD